jgi:hypothetical protein
MPYEHVDLFYCRGLKQPLKPEFPFFLNKLRVKHHGVELDFVEQNPATQSAREQAWQDL